MANNKRKGRTRIKLDAKKIALAKQLILREATTTVIANELNISRTFAWRLRKSLVNGVSLHERVIDPPDEDEEDHHQPETSDEMIVEPQTIENGEKQLNHQPFNEHIKCERATTEDEEDDDHNNNPHHSGDELEQNLTHHQQQQQQRLDTHHIEQQLIRQQNTTINNLKSISVATSVIQRTNELKLANSQQLEEQQKQKLALTTATTNAILIDQHQLHNTITVVQQQRLMEINKNAHLDKKNATATDSESDNDQADRNYQLPQQHHYSRPYQKQLEQQQQQQHEQPQQPHQETEHVNSQQQIQASLFLQKSTPLKEPQPEDTKKHSTATDNKVPLINQLAPAVAAAM